MNRLRLMQAVTRILSDGNSARHLISFHKTLWLGFVARYGYCMVHVSYLHKLNLSVKQWVTLSLELNGVQYFFA